MTVVSFDTTEESLEAVAADMEVKGLPQFRFFKVCGRGGLPLLGGGWALAWRAGSPLPPHRNQPPIDPPINAPPPPPPL